jgi:hypothetical protein
MVPADTEKFIDGFSALNRDFLHFDISADLFLSLLLCHPDTFTL